MSTKRRIISLIMATAIVLYVIFIPQYLQDQLERDPYREWISPNDEPYSGIINVWHIVGFKPYLGSVGSWLKNRAHVIEARHYGVFFEVTAMTVEECSDRMQKGEKADIYSFPSGWCAADMLRELEPETEYSLIGRLAGSGNSGDKILAVPYLYSGYMLSVNTSIAAEKGVTMPDDRIASVDWLKNAVKELDYKRGKKQEHVYGLSGHKQVAAMLGINGEIAEYERFRAQEASMAITDIRAVGDHERRIAAGNGFSFEICAVPYYTDLIQYIGIASDIEDIKVKYALELIDVILSEKAQKALETLGMFPVIETESPVEFEQSSVELLYSKMTDPAIPNTFELNTAKAGLDLAIERALKGDDGELRQIINTLVPNFKMG